VIDVAESAPQAQDRARQLVLAQAPTGHVHLMDALVAQVAVAVIPLPVPVVVEVAALQRPARSRPAPQVVVHGVGKGGRAFYPADRRSSLIAQRPGDLQFAELAGFEKRDGLGHTGAAADLRACLADLVGPPGYLDDAAAFADVVADRFFHVNV